MPERARLFLDTKTTSSTSYVELLTVEISHDAQGISFFSLAIDPDPDALYEMHIASILDVVEKELTAMWGANFEHLTSGVYQGFKAGDKIVLRHRSKDAAITVKTGVTLSMNEVTRC